MGHLEGYNCSMKNFASKYGPKVDDLRSQRVKRSNFNQFQQQPTYIEGTVCLASTLPATNSMSQGVDSSMNDFFGLICVIYRETNL